MATPDPVTTTLNQLIETCKDAENGFHTAAENVKTPELKQLFHRYEQQRANFATELQTEVQRLGGTPEDGGTVTAALHRGWMNLKALVGSKDECAILSECERAEDAARKAYEEAVRSTMPPEVRAVVARQYEQVQEAHGRIRALKACAAKE
jgi:uncharacterized protein (TIGR02284 family)